MRWARGGGVLAASALLAGLVWDARGAPLREAVFTELGGKVWVLDEGRPLKPAMLKGRVGGESAVKTGQSSRAEMEFGDRSLVRLGSNAVFALRPGTREMRLDEGAMLLHVPKGLGGTTTIRTAAATAAITGTTVIVSASKHGGFRLVVLEGLAEVLYAGGRRVRCRAGDMTMTSGGGADAGGPSQIHIEGMVTSSALLGGFKRTLPSLSLVHAAMKRQAELLASGAIQETGQTIGATSLEPLGDRDRIRSIRVDPKMDAVKDIRDTRPNRYPGGPK